MVSEEDEPSAPLNLTFEAVTATSFTATWLKPTQENGQLGDYQVRWRSKGGRAKVQKVTETRLEITNLNACDAYNVTVAATTGAGPGNKIRSKKKTSEAVPPAGSHPKVSSVASRSVTLKWTKPATKCEVVNYTVVYGGQVMWGNHVTLEVNSAYSETTTINIAGLTPYSNYSFSVVAATAAGKGEPSLPSYCETLEDVPSAPTDLNIEALNSTSVLVTWQAPEEENGIIKYTIRWKLASNGSEADDDQIITTPGDSYECEVPDLTGCKTYDFFVSASTSRGEGARNTKQQKLRCAEGNIPLADQRYTQMSSDAGSQYEIPLLTPPPQPPPIYDEYPDVMSSGVSKEIIDEYNRLPKPTKKTTEASKPCNQFQNRYADVLPFDENRVKLKSGEYINASHIDGGFIATQDPQQTTEDDELFWSMVWEHQVSIIVRLSADDRNLGNNQMGCAPYLPLDRRWVFNNGIEASVKEKRQEEATHTTTTVVLVKTEGNLTLKKFK
ncbi:receptor-type tyrosine-protein phosphatase delta-like, partial [Hyalella azteca]|uniref:Receptor-type tyrosine-protein phosphatase delta-like n=1 Tax=Hyalella azteca TaxID=294128 RepID=A0A979FPN7_HYAAZ